MQASILLVLVPKTQKFERGKKRVSREAETRLVAYFMKVWIKEALTSFASIQLQSDLYRSFPGYSRFQTP